MRSLVVASFIVAVGSMAACTTTRTTPHDTGHGTGTDSGPGPSGCTPGVTSICRGTQSIACNADGTEGAATSCGTQTCVANMGCRACAPGTGHCSGNDVQTCRADGSGYDTTSTCDPAMGQMCSASLNRCSSPCADAEANGSYIGCEYWPVAALNNAVGTQADGTDRRHSFHFGIAVANPGTTDATVTIEQNGATVMTLTVAGGALEVASFPWDDRLQPANLPTTGPAGGAQRGGAIPSVLVRNAAFHVTSNVPVTVYQFNPLEYTVGSGLTASFSYSNDASLLLPSHALTGNYIVISRPSHLLNHTLGAQSFTSESPGFFTLVGVEDSTSVQIRFTSHTTASTDGAVQAFSPGDTGTFTLGRGDVLQIASSAPPTCTPDGMDNVGGGEVFRYCAVGNDYDLTGTQIQSTGRLELIGGHNCDFVPHNRWACDHLEEGIYPLETWGNNALVVISQPLAAEPNVIRVISGDDGNAITFDPPSTHAPVTLSRGEFVEFEATSSFRAAGSASLTVAQFLVGQNYAGINSTATGGNGDPSESLAIPTEQYRSQYTFLAPETYAINFVGVSAPTGVDVLLDGAAISGFTGVGSTGFDTANVSITGGVHTMSSAMPFGIIVYGFGSYTSYMYPGGLDLHQINQPF